MGTVSTTNVLECGANLNCTLHAFSALALETSLILDHITRRLGAESNHRKEFESSRAQHTFDTFRTVFRLAWKAERILFDLWC